MSINALDKKTVKFLTTAQVITSVATAVKELVENSIDAEASSIDVKLVDNGASLIEVSDDGNGIAQSDMPFMALQSYTSKIKDFSDLESLDTYGFRGEALSSLCRVADVTVITRTKEDEAARSYSLTDEGLVTGCEICHHSVGTTVRAKTLFRDLPVRRQIMTSSKRSNQEVKSLLRSYAICRPKLRVNLRVNGSNLLAKSATETHRETLACLFGNKFVAQMEFAVKTVPELATIRMTLPRRDATELTEICQVGQHVFVNRRPVAYKEIEKLINKRLVDHFGDKIPGKKKLAFILSLDVPAADVDVNLEPNKMSVLLIKLSTIVEALDQMLTEYYALATSETVPEIDESSKHRDRTSGEHGQVEERSSEVNEARGSFVGPPSSKKRRLERPEKSSPIVAALGTNDHNKENRFSNACESRKNVVVGGFDEIAESISQLPVVDLGEDFNSEDIAKLPNLDPCQVEEILGGTSVTEDTASAGDNGGLTLEAWSKGRVPTNLRGGTDVRVYGNVAGDAIEAPETLEADSSTTGCRGFLRFSKDVRPLIIGENPGINFVEVAKALTGRWRKLSPEERGYYRDLAAAADATPQPKKHDATGAATPRPPKVPKISDEAAEKNRKRLIDMLEKMKHGLGRDNNCIRKTVVPYAIDMNVVTRQFRASRSNFRNNSPDNLVLGAIDENLWIVRTGTQIWALGLDQLLEGLNVEKTNSIQRTRDSVEELVARWLREKDGMSLLHPVFDLR